MSGYLIDTNVLSEYNRPAGPDAGVKKWVEMTNRSTQYISVLTLAEIRKGIELLPASRRRVELERWLERDLRDWFSGHVLVVDQPVADRWASLVAQGARTGRVLPTIDSLIAATALTHNLSLVTRNVKDYEGSGVQLVNPWSSYS